MDIGKHPLLKKINIVMHEIEKSGASEQLTEASTAASNFAVELEKYIDENKEKLNFIHKLFDECPDLEKDGLKEFDGYFTTYDNFLDRIASAWGGRDKISYGNDPFELIVDLINERDEAIEDIADLKTLALSRPFSDVAAERKRQDHKWGGPSHDDLHSVAQFVQWIRDYSAWARMMDSMRSPQKTRKRLIQVAALAVAAVESIDRTMKS